MKPDGRSLDIAVVGLGQAGGNIATEFFRRGYRALALNTAHTDLSALDPGGVYPAMPPERRLYIGLDGYDGAGADPTYGADCIAESADRIREVVVKETAHADAVILAAGLGGGTGSAINSLVNVLRDSGLPLLGLITLPTDSESGIAKVNAVRAINELVDAPLLGWIFIDNSRIATLNSDVSVVDYYAHINGRIASPLDALNRLNDRDDLRAIRSFDGEDLRKLLLSGGVLNYGVVELGNITPDEVIGSVRETLDASEMMPAGFDIRTVSYLGVVIEAPETMLARTPISAFEQIDERLKADTEGAALYRGVYRVADEGNPTTMRIICASQSLPHRIREILADARREGMAIRDKLQVELPTLDLGEIERFELFRPGARNRASDRPRKNRGRPSGFLDEIRMEVRPRKAPTEPPSPPPPPPPPHVTARPPTRPRAVPSPPRDSKAPPSNDDKDRKDKDSSKDHGLPKALDAAPQPAQPRPARPEGTSGGARPSRPPPAPPPSPPRASRSPPQAIAVESSKLMRLPDSEQETGDLQREAAVAARGSKPAPNKHEQPTDTGAEPKTAQLSMLTGDELPSPETYDAMVSEYLDTPDDGSRHQIARRLEDDSLSEHTVIRYYAVEAMSKLGREVFGSALLAATEDENEAVRAIAVEALRR